MIKISENLKVVCPQTVLGILKANSIKVEKKIDKLWLMLNDLEKKIRDKYHAVDDIYRESIIHDVREAYKNMGQDPSRYRPSSEALLRRILQGKGIYQINNVVDVNNLISLQTLFPVGAYNFEKIKGDIIFRIGKKNEKYQGIGKDIINIENLPVFSDLQGAFGGPTSDSQRTMITSDTKEMLLVIISFSGNPNSIIDNALALSKNLLERFAYAQNITTEVI